MHDHEKCTAVVARLVSFVADLPKVPSQNHVFQYHEIIKMVEETCGQNLSQFRIASHRLKSRVDTNPRRHWQTPFAPETSVEHAYFCAQVQGLVAYIKKAVGESAFVSD
jgi:hypothetical protein